MAGFVDWLNGYVWSNAMVYLILGVGLFYTIATRFLQFRFIKDMIRLTFRGGSSAAGVSSFQALSMSVGSRAGIGNIAGVATAIAFGGPGAVFWMWAMAFVSASTSFIETTLAQIYKSKQGGQYRGGAPYYIGKGLKMEWYGVIFAIVTMLSMTFLVPSIQVNTVSSSMENAFGINPLVTGVILVLLLAPGVFGGVKKIAKVAEYAVPFMTLGYITVFLIILVANIQVVPDVIVLIFSSAFSTHATFGGIIGSAIMWGVQRGAFSNAAGFGSETFETGAAEVSHPAKQGLVQAFAVYIDTLVICSATAFMILLTGMFNVESANKVANTNNIGTVEPGAAYTQLAVDSVIPGFGTAFIAIAIFFFAFTSLMTYSYKAETSLEFINRNKKKKITWPLTISKVAFMGVVLYSSTNPASLAWALGDLGFGTMTWLNLVAILLLSKPALKVLKDYEKQRKAGKDPVFNPKEAGIEGADFWENEYQGEIHGKKLKEADGVNVLNRPKEVQSGPVQ